MRLRTFLCACTALVAAGCATNLPPAPAAQVQQTTIQSTEPDEPTVRDMDPRDAIGGSLTYILRDGREYQVFVPRADVVPITLPKGSRITGTISFSDPANWRLNVTEAGRGRQSMAVITASADPGSKPTTAIVPTSDGVMRLRLIPRNTGHMSVAFHHQQKVSKTAPVVVGAPYAIDGPYVPWRPASVRDDGQKTWISFRKDIGAIGMPATFSVDSSGGTRPLNTRMIDGHLVADGVPGHIRFQLGEESVDAMKFVP